MTKEEYISFETAKLLKEKGFDKEFDADIVRYYDEDGSLENVDYRQLFVCPSLGMVMSWLREVYRLNIHINVCNKYGSSGEVCYLWYINEVKPGVRHLTNVAYEDTYEQAAEAGIRYCLERLVGMRVIDKVNVVGRGTILIVGEIPSCGLNIEQEVLVDGYGFKVRGIELQEFMKKSGLILSPNEKVDERVNIGDYIEIKEK